MSYRLIIYICVRVQWLWFYSIMIIIYIHFFFTIMKHQWLSVSESGDVNYVRQWKSILVFCTAHCKIIVHFYNQCAVQNKNISISVINLFALGNTHSKSDPTAPHSVIIVFRFVSHTRQKYILFLIQITFQGREHSWTTKI